MAIGKRFKSAREGIDVDKAYPIAEAKMKDLNANDIAAATKIIEGSARAMGLQVLEG